METENKAEYIAELPIEIQKMLKNLDFPIDRNGIIEQARKSKAIPDILRELGMFFWSAEAKTSTGAPPSICLRRFPDPAKFKFTSVPGFSVSNWDSISVKASVRLAAADTVIASGFCPETEVSFVTGAPVSFVTGVSVSFVASFPLPVHPIARNTPNITNRTISSFLTLSPTQNIIIIKYLRG